MKITKPIIITAAVVALVAGTGVAFAATDTFTTPAPANDRPTRTWFQPAAEAPATTPETSSTASPENDTPTTETPLVNSQTNKTEAPVANEAPAQNQATPTVEAPAPIENVTNVSNDNSSAVSNNSGEGVGVTHN